MEASISGLGSGKVYGPDKGPAEKWQNKLKQHGINLDMQTIIAWLAKYKGNIGPSEFKELVGGDIKCFTIMFHPSSLKYDIKISETGWDGYFGDGNGKLDKADSRTADELFELFDKTSAKAKAQSKTIWELLNSSKILWMDEETKIQTVVASKDYMEKDVIDKNIDNDTTLTAEQKNDLKSKVRGHLENIDDFAVNPYTGRIYIINSDLNGNPYDYFGNDPEDNETLQYLGEICQQAKTWKGDAKSRANDMWSLFHMNMIFGTGVSIQAVYDREVLKHPGLLPAPSTYDTVAKIYGNIKALKKNVENLDESIKKEKNKDLPNQKLIDKLQEERDINNELLQLSRKFEKFVCVFAETGGKDYEKFFAEEGLMPKDMSKPMTLADCLNIFADPEVAGKTLTHIQAKAEIETEKKKEVGGPAK
jgi:hypothetical protein